ncbi:hypothetical protein [uncultured Pedobacter sp.]|uniref:hypothetical protein n=1 Tax=uncultured Pedobacter sp. TaxID=246139 RepID=UPI0026028286|nr:hypothetical protein [uncultured Pedobacter sp.]
MPIINEKEAQNSAIIFMYQTNVFSQIIYGTTLIAVITILTALPFIYTTISVN